MIHNSDREKVGIILKNNCFENYHICFGEKCVFVNNKKTQQNENTKKYINLTNKVIIKKQLAHRIVTL